MQRTPLGKCIHCGEITKLPKGSAEEEEQIKERFIIQLQNKDGSTVEFFYSDLTNIIKQHFKIVKEFLVTSPQFIVAIDDDKNVDEEFEGLFNKSRAMVPGLTPILQRDTRLSSSQFVLSFTFLTLSSNRSNIILKSFFFITILSIFLSGLLVSVKYFAIMENRKVVYSNVENYLNPYVWLYSFGFLMIVLGTLFLRKILIEKDYLNHSGYRPSFIWIFVPPFYELGTLGFLLVETHPHFSKSASIKTAFRGNFITWIISLVLLLAFSPLNLYSPQEAKVFQQNSIIASGEYEPALFTLIRTSYVTLFGSSPSYFSTHFIHPLFLAALIPFYITGLSFLPAIQLFGGAIIQSSSNRLVAYFTTFIVVIALFWVGLIWLAILIFLFQDRIGRIYVLNGASSKPPHWKLILVMTILVAVLTFPFPT
ncbi:MAG: hypothetical protein D6732_04940 [Methanobacteriota archaeon]|nr:MAG: hypothetical protein D6732_04940 [Euryarchaeota archaeon]